MEEWKDIKGYEGLYQVSSEGRVKSLSREVETLNKYGTMIKTICSRILVPCLSSVGYMNVNLYKDKKMKRFQIHRLVAEAFVPNPHSLPIINHKDECKTNNFASNLEWCSVEYNNRYGSKPKKLSEAANKRYRDISGKFI